MNARFARTALALLFAGVCGTVLSSYVLIDDKWPDGTVTMQLQLGTPARALSDGSSSWGSVAESALGEWNGAISRLQFNAVRDSSSAKGDGNGINNVFFSNDVYGMAFDTNVLAVTTNWLRRNVRVEGDVVFNSAVDWDSYSGARRRAVDFRRVALHEFGHVLGLTHPDDNGQAVAAVMNSHISDADHLTADDIGGAQALFGGGGGSVAPGGGNVVVSFPPRDESLDFRNQLEAEYRNGLRRGPTSTSVDVEGDVVWTSGVSALPRVSVYAPAGHRPRGDADRRQHRARRLWERRRGRRAVPAPQRGARFPEPARSEVSRRPAARPHIDSRGSRKATWCGPRSTCGTA